MNYSYSDWCMHYYGYELNEECLLEQEESSLRRDAFFSGIRSQVYKNVCKGVDGRYQWNLVSGKRHYRKDGSKIHLAKETTSVLSRIFERFNETEGRDLLFELNISVPENEDDVIEWISNALPKREISARAFRFVLAKYKKQFC